MNFTPTIGASFLRRHASTLVHGFYRRAVRGLPYAFSFNIADRCPVGCDCYWRAQARVAELSDKEVIAFFEEKKRQGYIHANIVGGEPYVRPELLVKIAGIIPFNWVITSATTPLRRLRNTTHIVSIDGGSAETHNRVRKMAGLYERILRNLDRARAGGDFPTFIHTTLNALNYTELEQIIDTWSRNGLADGIFISSMTPIRGVNNHALSLQREQRIRIVEELLRLKRSYPEFICMTEAMIDRLHPAHTDRLHPGVCDVAKLIEAYDASGKRIPQCILSDKADCSQCGCVISTMSDGTKPSTLAGMFETANIMRKTLTYH